MSDQHWADPIERPTPRCRRDALPVVFAWLLALAAAVAIVWIEVLV